MPFKRLNNSHFGVQLANGLNMANIFQNQIPRHLNSPKNVAIVRIGAQNVTEHVARYTLARDNRLSHVFRLRARAKVKMMGKQIEGVESRKKEETFRSEASERNGIEAKDSE